MSMAITCPRCGAGFDATLFQFGHRVRCGCGEEVSYPGVDLRGGHMASNSVPLLKSRPIIEGVPAVVFGGFKPTIFEFLEELADNNNRHWFQENKGRYEGEVLEPALAFIRAFQPRLNRISPYFVASDRRVGGSLIRVYRDTRFSKDRDPYKTNVGIQFRHEQGRDIHAPGFYVHIAPSECFLAVGLWHPDPMALGQIRQAIIEWPDRWKRARDDKKFRQRFSLDGGSLKRPPRGFPADHPWIEDLKRTDFIGVEELEERDVLGKGFLNHVAASFTASRLFIRFLCDALKVPF
jgi:uncharacterized protein (TIGR02453 family)